MKSLVKSKLGDVLLGVGLFVYNLFLLLDGGESISPSKKYALFFVMLVSVALVISVFFKKRQ